MTSASPEFSSQSEQQNLSIQKTMKLCFALGPFTGKSFQIQHAAALTTLYPTTSVPLCSTFNIVNTHRATLL